MTDTTATIPSFKVADSVAFVTGTNKRNGIGRAIVKALLDAGAKRVYATARDASSLEDLVAEHKAGQVVPVALDVTDFDMIASLGKRFPDVNLVVNNAGYMAFTTSLGDFEGIQKEIAVNYLGPVAIVQSFAPVLKDQSHSAIVNVASIASLINFPQGGTYSASKAAAHSLTQAQRRELPQTLVVGVYPGPIDTDMAKSVDLEKTTPETVGKAVVNALANSQEDLYPDPMAENMYQGWKADAKAMEQKMTEMAAASM
jgi:NAD(P)-dependent dehydrogenase (short-subunit alcohol dehydrogenase family)